jgi:hypothetical protein
MRPPWADSDSPWDRISFGTLAFGGLVEVDGDALKRKVSRHRASGANGSRITDRGLDTVEVTIRSSPGPTSTRRSSTPSATCSSPARAPPGAVAPWP